MKNITSLTGLLVYGSLNFGTVYNTKIKKDCRWTRFWAPDRWKTFGTDLETAPDQLNKEWKKPLMNKSFRIDRTWKKWSKNMLCHSFWNLIFDNLWNRILLTISFTLCWTLGLKERGGYYDRSRALRDMVQNHTLQLCHCLPWINQLPLLGCGAEKIKVLSNCTINRWGTKEIRYPWSAPFRYDRRKKRYLLSQWAESSTLSLLRDL